jgi:hypothetical protein
MVDIQVMFMVYKNGFTGSRHPVNGSPGGGSWRVP